MPKYTCPECGAKLDYGFIKELEEFLPIHEKFHTKITIKPRKPTIKFAGLEKDTKDE